MFDGAKHERQTNEGQKNGDSYKTNCHDFFFSSVSESGTIVSASSFNESNILPNSSMSALNLSHSVTGRTPKEYSSLGSGHRIQNTGNVVVSILSRHNIFVIVIRKIR